MALERKAAERADHLICTRPRETAAAGVAFGVSFRSGCDQAMVHAVPSGTEVGARLVTSLLF